MNLGLFNLHLVGIPFSNELTYTIGSVLSYTVTAYIGVIKPEITNILNVLETL